MNKLFSILLLFCLCFSLLGYHLVFRHQIAAAKSEMKAFLKTHQHHKDVLEFSFLQKEAGELEWENDHEFRYQDEMYDVIEKKKEGGRLLIRCIQDQKETALLNEYQKTNKRRHSGSLALQLITMPFILPSGYAIDPPVPLVGKHSAAYSFTWHNVARSIVLPPPEVG